MADDKSIRDTPGTIYTFYSYKGGVGLSMAVANVGVLLALSQFDGKGSPKVLLVDWDLEAPGLEAYFERSKHASLDGDVQFVPGILDLLESKAKERPISWRSCLLKVNFAGGTLDLISSGSKPADIPPVDAPEHSTRNYGKKVSGNYRQRVQQLDWGELFDKYDIGNFLLDLREDWRNHYDFVLIDSRTGVTDVGDVCTVLFPDALVLLFVSNYQNIDGIRDIVDRARSARSKLPIDRQHLMAIPISSRDESRSEYSRTIEWRAIFTEKLGYLFDDWLHKDYRPIDVINSLYIPYFPIWSFGERIPVLESASELSDPSSLGAAYSRLTQLLKNRLDWSAVATSGILEIAQKQAELALERSRRESSEKRLMSIRVQRRYFLVGGIAFVGSAGALGAVYLGTRPSLENRVRFAGASSSPILGANVSPTGQDFATALRDASARTWTTSGSPVSFYEGHSGAVNDAAYSPNASQLVTASADKTAIIWSTSTTKIFSRLEGHKGSINTAEFSPDGRRVVTASSDGTARIWELIFPDKFLELTGHDGAVLDASFDSDGSRVVTASLDSTAIVWDAAIGKRKFTLEGHSGAINTAAFSPDGTKIVTGSSDATARIWDASSGRQIQTMRQKDSVVAVAFSTDGRTILVACRDLSILIWDYERNSRQLIETKGLTGSLTAARFFPDGKSVLLTSFNGFQGVWI